jgi:hypothetical protein
MCFSLVVGEVILSEVGGMVKEMMSRQDAKASGGLDICCRFIRSKHVDT